jgi:adenine deaminase
VRTRAAYSLASRRTLIEVALGRRPADLYLRNARVVNVYSGEILEGQDLAIYEGRIAYVGPPDEKVKASRSTLDIEGSYLVPGFVDAHAHVDFFANPISLTPHLLATGTTTVMADPHEAVGALGSQGLEALVTMTRGLRLKFFFSVPVATPPLPELEGPPVLSTEEVESWLSRPEMRAISEVTPWVRVVSCDEDLLRKFEIAEHHEKRIEGHTTGASLQKLSALVAAGLTSCHEAINAEEARDRLRLGLHVMLRQGSIREDLDDLLDVITHDVGVDTSRVMLTPDWMDPPAILRRGYMDGLVRAAIEGGVSPVVAIQMATLNPARYLGLDTEIGGLGPGRLADVLVVDDLEEVRPRLVIADGQVVAKGGEYVGEGLPPPVEALSLPWLPHRVIPGQVTAEDFQVKSPAPTNWIIVPAMRIVDKTITERLDTGLPVRDGRIQLPEEGDVLKAALWNSELPGFMVAFLTGFGAAVGGLASSLAHEPHRPLVIGRKETDMALALNRMLELGGGIVLAHEGRVRSEIPLPLGGLMSLESLERLASQMDSLNGLLRGMGCSLDSPLFTIGFLTFSVLPWVRLTPHGVRDVRSGRIIWPDSAG